MSSQIGLDDHGVAPPAKVVDGVEDRRHVGEISSGGDEVIAGGDDEPVAWEIGGGALGDDLLWRGVLLDSEADSGDAQLGGPASHRRAALLVDCDDEFGVAMDASKPGGDRSF